MFSSLCFFLEFLRIGFLLIGHAAHIVGFCAGVLCCGFFCFCFLDFSVPVSYHAGALAPIPVTFCLHAGSQIFHLPCLNSHIHMFTRYH